jgi:hypothetical protein
MPSDSCTAGVAEAKSNEVAQVLKRRTEEVEIMLRKQKVDKARVEVRRSLSRKQG